MKKFVCLWSAILKAEIASNEMFKHELRRVSGPKARLRLDLMCKGIQGYLECIKKKPTPKSHDRRRLRPFPEEKRRVWARSASKEPLQREVGKKEAPGCPPRCREAKFASLFPPGAFAGETLWGGLRRWDHGGKAKPNPLPPNQPGSQLIKAQRRGIKRKEEAGLPSSHSFGELIPRPRPINR